MTFQGGMTSPAGLTWRGAWSSVATYAGRDAVSYNGASYYALQASVNQTPAPGGTGHWGVLTAPGMDYNKVLALIVAI
jgi:hypothetical protein